MQYQLHLTGYVGGYDFDRAYVDYILGQHEGKPVNVLIDSLGGSLATALSIASAFRNHGDVTVHFVGMNASAATIASLGAKHVSMDASAMYLAHKCSTSFFEWGSMNSDQLQDLQEQIAQMQTDLDKMDANVAQMYAAKCKDKNAKEILDLMKVGGWLTAKEALEWGFVDEITEWQEAAPVLTDMTASAMTAAGIPIPNIPVQYNAKEKDEDGLMHRFIAALTGFFSRSHAYTTNVGAEENGKPTPEEPKSTIMKKIYALIGALLSVEAFAMEDGKTTLTESQMQSLEDALKQKDDALAKLKADFDAKVKEAEDSKTALTNAKADLDTKTTELASVKAELEAFKKKPAEEPHQIVDDANRGQNEARTEAENYIATLNTARSLFNQLP